MNTAKDAALAFGLIPIPGLDLENVFALCRLPGEGEGLTSKDIKKIVDATLQTKPAGATHWSCRTMAQAAKVSKATVNRIWQSHRIQPHRTKNFKLSRDPKFLERLTDVVGLYLNPPEKALVLCVDEKSQIQALDRTQPGLPIKKGRCGTMTHDYKRNGAGVDWPFFDILAFEKTVPDNEGRWALPWFEPEITPLVNQPGQRANFSFATAAPEVRIRAVVEAQAMSLRAHSLWIGAFQTLRVTGGASQSVGILQTLADVFDSPVETIATTDSAALGAAMIAAHAAGGLSYEALASAFCPPTRTIRPRAEAAAVYAECLPAFRAFETAAQTR